MAERTEYEKRMDALAVRLGEALDGEPLIDGIMASAALIAFSLQRLPSKQTRDEVLAALGTFFQQLGVEFPVLTKHPEDRPQFSVAVFYTDDSTQYLCRLVSVTMAAEIFQDAVRTAEGVPHLMSRVIMTDGGDAICREWPVKSSEN